MLSPLVLSLRSYETVILNDCGEVLAQGCAGLSMQLWDNDEEPDDEIGDLLYFLPYQEDRRTVKVTLVGGRSRTLNVYEGEELQQTMRDVLRFLVRGGHPDLVHHRQALKAQDWRKSDFVPEEPLFRAFAKFLLRSERVLVG